MRPGRCAPLLATAAGIATAAALAAGWSQRRSRRALFASVRCRAEPIDPQAADDRSLDSRLPAPVARYLKQVLAPGARSIRLARYEQVGTLRTDPAGDQWRHFSADQVIAATPPAFAWDARVAMPALLHVRVRDSLLDGVGAGAVVLLSTVAVASARGGPELNAGALHRFLAEAVWCPTALLPSARLRWQAIDDARALATLADRNATVSLEFRFSPRGEVESIYTPGRWASFGGGEYRQLPWEGRFHDYAQQGAGVLVPTEGEVGWYLNGVWRKVWQGRITRAAFE